MSKNDCWYVLFMRKDFTCLMMFVVIDISVESFILKDKFLSY